MTRITNTNRTAVKELGRRIREVAESHDGVIAFAEKTGISSSQMFLYANGTSSPSYQALLAIATHGGVDFNWLMTGKGKKELPPAFGFQYHPHTDESAQIKAIAEHLGYDPNSYRPLDFYTYPNTSPHTPNVPKPDTFVLPATVLDLLGCKDNQLWFCIRAHGPSLAPRINDRDTVLISTDPIAKPQDDTIYLVDWEGNIRLLRYDHVEKAYCTNADAPKPLKLSPDEHAIKLIGEAVWRIGSNEI